MNEKNASNTNLITQEESRGEIQRDERGRFLPGHSPNPAGRPKKFDWGAVVRGHEKVPQLIERIFRAALDDNDERQETAWRILMDKIAPDLAAQKIQLEGQEQVGIIIMPAKAMSIKEWNEE